jgi:uncharacterized protein YcbX
MQEIAQTIGVATSLWRYPIKSMLGEELNSTTIVGGSLLGDRSYALIDTETSKVVSAKNPRKWPHLFDFRASFVEPLQVGGELPPVRVTLPDGTIVTTKQRDFNQIMSNALKREVTLSRATLSAPDLEEFWPEIEGLAYNNVVTDEAMPANTFFDISPIHILTTSTIERLRELYPQGRFEVRRFRPNIVITTTGAEKDFVENAWVGHTLAVGSEVRLSITGPCTRCVMTTLSQADLPSDPGILRTAARNNKANVGVYATVLQGGTIRRGDVAKLE